MKQFYRNVTRMVTLPSAAEILFNFGSLSLEHFANSEMLPESPVIVRGCGNVIAARHLEVPCITMGLCIVGRYKCEAPLNNEKCGDEPCWTH